MKQLVILSGKGGTGKTSLAAAFAHLAHEGSIPVRAVLADADVDAANLELVLHPELMETHDFTGGSLAVIDPQLCQGCGDCERACRFDAILPGLPYQVDAIACEGCAACVYQCPEEAIRMEPQTAGQWRRSESRYGPLFHADLKPAQENSGKLVTLVKQQARLAALDGDYPLLIVDGPPGIGCPVISALSGADLALIVAEPTAAGVHDMQRILETAAHFRIPALVCVNKADLYPEAARQIEAFCRERGLELVGSIPFDETVTLAMMNGEPVTAFNPESPASREIIAVWQNMLAALAIQPIPKVKEMT
ncbi:MAG: P-loop ATPase MinD superfamily [Anaerolineaceae bacterium]|nr:MAG: P-loop ATPase MinD superfamily [Anaerolineaceae bacterium]